MKSVAAGSLMHPLRSLAFFRIARPPNCGICRSSLAVKYSYQQAADILNEFLPDISSFNHATTRNRVLAVGKVIEADVRAEIAAKPIVKEPADQMIVGIDGAFVRATSDLDDLARERVRSVLRAAGRGPATKLTVLSDGEDAMRLMAGQWLNGRVEHRLDWFHLRRRIERLGRSLYWTINYGDADSEAKMTRYRRNLRSVRWNLWHYGRSRHARWFIALSRFGAQILSHRNEIEAAGGDLARIEDAYNCHQ
jgi:hypothetical protein